MVTLELAGNTASMNKALPMVNIFLRRQLLQKPLDSKFNDNEKKEVLTWRNTLLRQVKRYTDKCGRSNKRQFYSTTECQIISRWIWNFYRWLLKWRFRVAFAKQPNFCLANNSCDVALKAWHGNMAINRFLMSIRQWHICVNISKKLKISVPNP